MNSESKNTFPESYTKFIEAADALLMEGDRPTAAKVHNRVGKGSMSTCNEALKYWWEALSGRLHYYHQYPDLDPEVVDLAAQFIEEANKKGVAWWASREKELLDKLDDASDHAGKVEAERDQLTVQIEQVKAENQNASAIKDKEIEALTAKLAETESQLEQLNDAFLSIEKQLGEVKAELASEQELRKKADIRNEELVATNRSQSERIEDMREERAVLASKSEELAHEIGKTENATLLLLQQLEDKERETDALRKDVKAANVEMKEAMKEKRDLLAKTADLENSVDRISKELIASRAENDAQANYRDVRINELQERVLEQASTIKELVSLKDRKKDETDA